MSSTNQLLKKFQMNGLNVRQDALNIFESEFKHGQPSYRSIDDFITVLIDKMLTEMNCDDYIIDSEMAQKAIDILRDSRQTQQPNEQDPNQIIVRNAVDLEQQILGSNFEFHYQQLVKQLKKLPAFESGQFRLMNIDDLNTYESNIEIKCIVFAMIRYDPTRIMQFLLEDPTGKIPIHLSSQIVWREWATFQHGIYLIEGIYEGQRDSFQITSIGLPPMPIQLNSIENVPNTIDDDDDHNDNDNDDDRMLIFLTDVHLDQPTTMEALKFLFTGYNSLQQVPEIFILIGDFSSTPIDNFDFKDNMKNLVKLISTFKKLSQNSKFIFVPGPNDPSSTSVDSFVKYQFTSDHFPTTTTRLKNYDLPSNPFYLRFDNRNLCIFSNRILKKFAKNIINSHEQVNTTKLTTNDSTIMKDFLKSIGRLIMTNAHLTAGLCRNYTNSLSLFSQMTDLFFLADTESPFVECQPFKLNKPSPLFTTSLSFSKNNFQFIVYYPKVNRLEESQISI